MQDKIIYKLNNVDEDFDEKFYSEFYPETKNFFQPFCLRHGVSNRDRLFIHYKKYGNQGILRHKNFKALLEHYFEFKPPSDLDNSKLDRNQLCIIAHVHYIDIWENELKHYIKEISSTYNLIITINNKEYKERIKEEFPKATILFIENYGADVFPFIEAFNFLKDSNLKCEYILKLHTKKSISFHPQFAKIWRNHLYSNLCRNIDFIIDLFRKDDAVGMVGAPNNILSLSEDEDNANLFYTHKYRKLLSIKDEKLEFLYGTMFVVKFDILTKFIYNTLSIHDFESSHKHNQSVPHAFERLFASMVRDCNKKIILLGQ